MPSQESKLWLDRLTRDVLTEKLLPLVRSDEFSALASDLGSPTDIHTVGAKLQQTGLVQFNPDDEQAVRSIVRTLAAKTYDFYYNQHS